MCKTVDFIVKNAKGLYVIGGIIVAIAGWFFMMQGMPARVSSLEKDVAELKVALASQNTKLDMIVESVFQIRGALLSK